MPPHNVSRLHELCTILSTDDPSQNYSDILRQGNRTVKGTYQYILLCS